MCRLPNAITVPPEIFDAQVYGNQRIASNNPFLSRRNKSRRRDTGCSGSGTGFPLRFSSEKPLIVRREGRQNIHESSPASSRAAYWSRPALGPVIEGTRSLQKYRAMTDATSGIEPSPFCCVDRPGVGPAPSHPAGSGATKSPNLMRSLAIRKRLVRRSPIYPCRFSG